MVPISSGAWPGGHAGLAQPGTFLGTSPAPTPTRPAAGVGDRLGGTVCQCQSRASPESMVLCTATHQGQVLPSETVGDGFLSSPVNSGLPPARSHAASASSRRAPAAPGSAAPPTVPARRTPARPARRRGRRGRGPRGGELVTHTDLSQPKLPEHRRDLLACHQPLPRPPGTGSPGYAQIVCFPGAGSFFTAARCAAARCAPALPRSAGSHAPPTGSEYAG